MMTASRSRSRTPPPISSGGTLRSTCVAIITVKMVTIVAVDEADPQIAGVDGNERVIGESRQVVCPDRFVAERIGHTCCLATV